MIYAYTLSPIDIGWENLKTVKETLLFLFDTCSPFFDKFASEWDHAKTLAKENGWDGDFRTDPAVFWIPTQELEFAYGFVFKQNNNGDTFIVSPRPLPWLERTGT
jgi:hypothetical protein